MARQLSKSKIPTSAIHSNRSQNQRARALQDFKDGKTRVLVATDIAARGIDVEGITHVINFDFPPNAEDYIHRIGRTGRAKIMDHFVYWSEKVVKQFIAKKFPDSIFQDHHLPLNLNHTKVKNLVSHPILPRKIQGIVIKKAVIPDAIQDSVVLLDDKSFSVS